MSKSQDKIWKKTTKIIKRKKFWTQRKFEEKGRKEYILPLFYHGHDVNIMGPMTSHRSHDGYQCERDAAFS